MISTELYEKLTKSTMKLIDDVIDEMFKNMMSSIDIEKLESKLISTFEIRFEFQNVINKNRQIMIDFKPRIDKEIDKAIHDGTIKVASENDDELLEINPRMLPINDSQAIADVIERIQNATKFEYSEMFVNSLNESAKQYMNMMDDLTADILLETKSPTDAISSAVDEFSDAGIHAFTNKAGGKMSLDNYARMILRTNIKTSAMNAVLQRQKEGNNNYIEVSSHVNARLKCADDQGFIYSLDGNTDNITDLYGNIINVKSFSETSNGEPDGLFGVNCTHQMYGFYPGLSTQANLPITVDETKKDYAIREKQRYIERNIRKYKTRLNNDDHAGIKNPKNNELLKKWNKTQNAFLDKHDLSENISRNKVI